MEVILEDRANASMTQVAIGALALTVLVGCADKGADSARGSSSSTGNVPDYETCFHPRAGVCAPELATDTNKAACREANGTPPDPGTWQAHCPTARIIGCCLTPDPTQYKCAYLPRLAGTDDPELDCKQKIGGAWTITPP